MYSNLAGIVHDAYTDVSLVNGILFSVPLRLSSRMGHGLLNLQVIFNFHWVGHLLTLFFLLPVSVHVLNVGSAYS